MLSHFISSVRLGGGNSSVDHSSQTYVKEIHTYESDKGDLLECFTGCGLVSPTMADYEWKVPNSGTCSVYQARILSWSSVFQSEPKEVGSSEELARVYRLGLCVNLAQARVIREERASVEEMPP